MTPDEWRKIEGELNLALETLADGRDSRGHSAAVLTLVRLLSTTEAGRELLAGRLAAQDAVAALPRARDNTAALSTVLAVLDLDAAPASTTERGITLKAGGLGGGKSFKLKNFRLDTVELLKLGSASVVAAQAAVAAALTPIAPLVIVAGVLTVVQSLVASTTVAIGEDEASLFWSLIQTAAEREDKTATEIELRAASDRHRQEFGLDPFTPADFLRALRTLQGLSSITAAGEGRWRLTESYRVS
ncbi:hypothetical protein [Nocardia sp. NPDC051832]|uniref:hypothetical protein n=1 Tax=Nocardia sp. NPDC051832 TaxID=3155673 RepID=UPI003433B392